MGLEPRAEARLGRDPPVRRRSAHTTNVSGRRGLPREVSRRGCGGTGCGGPVSEARRCPPTWVLPPVACVLMWALAAGTCQPLTVAASAPGSDAPPSSHLLRLCLGDAHAPERLVRPQGHRVHFRVSAEVTTKRKSSYPPRGRSAAEAAGSRLCHLRGGGRGGLWRKDQLGGKQNGGQRRDGAPGASESGTLPGGSSRTPALRGPGGQSPRALRPAPGTAGARGANASHTRRGRSARRGAGLGVGSPIPLLGPDCAAGL